MHTRGKAFGLTIMAHGVKRAGRVLHAQRPKRLSTSIAKRFGKIIGRGK